MLAKRFLSRVLLLWCAIWATPINRRLICTCVSYTTEMEFRSTRVCDIVLGWWFQSFLLLRLFQFPMSLVSVVKFLWFLLLTIFALPASPMNPVEEKKAEKKKDEKKKDEKKPADVLRSSFDVTIILCCLLLFRLVLFVVLSPPPPFSAHFVAPRFWAMSSWFAWRTRWAPI